MYRSHQGNFICELGIKTMYFQLIFNEGLTLNPAGLRHRQSFTLTLYTSSFRKYVSILLRKQYSLVSNALPESRNRTCKDTDNHRFYTKFKINLSQYQRGKNSKENSYYFGRYSRNNTQVTPNTHQIQIRQKINVQIR